MRPTAQWYQSSHQENRLPGPLLRQPHHHHHASTNPSRPPPSNPWVSIQVSLCEWLPLCLSALSGTSHSRPQPPVLLHTDSLGDTDRERRGGEKEGGGGCYLVALSLCYLSSPFCDRFTTEKTAEYIWIHVQPLSLSHTHIAGYHITHTQKAERDRRGQRGVNQGHGCEPGLNEVWKAVVKALWPTVTGIQTHSMPRGKQELQ